VSRRRGLCFEFLEPRLALSGGLTIITHGFQGNGVLDPFTPSETFPEWVLDMARAINHGLPANEQDDDSAIEKSVISYKTNLLPPNGVPLGGSPRFLMLNWLELSTTAGTANDDEVAGKLAAILHTRLIEEDQPLDLHFIGHSRGAYVNADAIRRLVELMQDGSRIGYLQMTILDSQPFHGLTLGDGSIEELLDSAKYPLVASAIDRSDNYYQQVRGSVTDFIEPAGESIKGTSFELRLSSATLGKWPGRPDFPWEHAEVHDWYHWTIDTEDSFFPEYSDFDLNKQQFTFHATPKVRSDLYPMDPAGHGKNVGYYWSRNGGGWNEHPTRLVSTTAVGDQFRIDTTVDYPGSPDIAMDGNGNFVVVWASFTNGGGADGQIYARLYDVNGVPLKDEFRVNTRIPNDQDGPRVAMNDAGDFVVVWTRTEGDEAANEDGSEVYARRYSSSGQPLDGEFRVNTTTFRSQNDPDVAVLADGSFIVVWSGLGLGDMERARDVYDSEGGVFGQRYSAAGVPIGGEFLINSYTDHGQWLPAIGVAADGSFVVTWMSLGQAGPENYSSVYAQRFSPVGDRIGNEFRVNEAILGNQGLPAIGMAANGDFVISWSSSFINRFPSPVKHGLYTRRYNAVGEAQSNETHIGGWRGLNNLAVNGKGEYALTFTNSGAGTFGNASDVSVMLYDPSGAAKSGNLVSNSYTTGRQLDPVVAMSSKQDVFTVVWEGDGPGQVDGVYARRYRMDTRSQVSVSSLDASGSGKPVISNVQFIEIPPADQLPNKVKFPAEFLRSTITLPSQTSTLALSPSSAGAALTIYLPPDTNNNTYYVQSPGNRWQEFLFDGVIGTQYSGNVAVIHLVDGQRGDSDLIVNGIIEFRGATALDEITWHNRAITRDVNRDGQISPIDALIIINDLNLNGARGLPLTVKTADRMLIDTGGDGTVAPQDVLLVINFLNEQANVEGESELWLTFPPIQAVEQSPRVFKHRRITASEAKLISSQRQSVDPQNKVHAHCVSLGSSRTRDHDLDRSLEEAVADLSRDSEIVRTLSDRH
jgi:hypothetical protein